MWRFMQNVNAKYGSGLKVGEITFLSRAVVPASLFRCPRESGRARFAGVVKLEYEVTRVA